MSEVKPDDLYACVECEWEGAKHETDLDCCPKCGSNCLFLEYSKENHEAH